MTDSARSELIRQLKTEVQNHPDLVSFSDKQLSDLISELLEDKIDWARRESPEAYYDLSAMNFKEKKLVVNSVFEAIRGLGVLGMIMGDADITKS